MIPTWRSADVEAGHTVVLDGWLERTQLSLQVRDAVRAMLAENVRLRSVLGHCPRGIAVLDEQGRLVGFNRELGALLGAAPELGQPFDRFFDAEDRVILAEVVRCAGTDQRSAGVLRTISADQREIEFFAATLPGHADLSVGIVLAGEDRTSALRDVRDRAEIDIANQELAFRLASATVAAEVHARLDDLRATLDALARDTSASTGVDACKRVVLELEDLLARRTRPPQGTVPESSVALEPLARRALRLGVTGAARRRAVGHVDVDPGVRVHMVERDVLQILFQLVTNAVHAIEARSGFGVVEIEAHEEGGRVFVTVRDDGVGIEPSLLRTIFTPGATTTPGASGLGLAIVKALVESAGGAVRVVSEPGAGTSFVLDLPGDLRGEDGASQPH